jgi:hypothetical protein
MRQPRQCGNWLRERTRDTDKFKVLFDELVTYGFRRNLFGIKYAALGIDLAVVVGCGIALWRGVPLDLSSVSGGKLVLIGAFTLIHAAYVAFAVTEGSVRQAAQQYARQLLMSCETLAAGTG